ncbi:MAG TPA: hypothetical protein PLZ29_08980, partial [Spirochaetota bacterium]|nr:hypothetical protein [Spirochaetota bacterium]
MINVEEEITAHAEFYESFNFNLSLLMKRYLKFKNISPYDKNTEVEWFTYFDCLITQFRAMFIENEQNKNNYTYQNFLNLYGKHEVVSAINTYLNEPFINEDFFDFNGEILTIRNAIKFVADKFICHYDKTSLEERARQELISNTLSNVSNNSVNNLEIILTKIFKMLKLKQ